MSCVDPILPPPPLTVVRGESKVFLLTVADASTKITTDLTGGKMWFTVKNRLEDPAGIIVKKNAAAGGVDGQILITIPQLGIALGQAQIFLDPADTSGLDPDQAYWCDVWVQLPNAKLNQVVSNRNFVIQPAVTTVFY